MTNKFSVTYHFDRDRTVKTEDIKEKTQERLDDKYENQEVNIQHILQRDVSAESSTSATITFEPGGVDKQDVMETLSDIAQRVEVVNSYN